MGLQDLEPTHPILAHKYGKKIPYQSSRLAIHQSRIFHTIRSLVARKLENIIFVSLLSKLKVLVWLKLFCNYELLHFKAISHSISPAVNRFTLIMLGEIFQSEISYDSSLSIECPSASD